MKRERATKEKEKSNGKNEGVHIFVIGFVKAGE